MGSRIVIYLCLLETWMVLFHSYNEAIEFKMTNAVCKSRNESWFAIHQCRLRAISRNKTTLNFNATVLHPAKVIHVHVEAFKKANTYMPWLINETVDVCRFLNKPFNPAAIIIFKLFREYTNFNHTCPYLGPQIIKGFYPRWDILPHTIPTGDYLLASVWSFERRVQFEVSVYFTFTENLT